MMDFYGIASHLYDQGLRECDRLHIKREHPSLSWSSVDLLCHYLGNMEKVEGRA